MKKLLRSLLALTLLLLALTGCRSVTPAPPPEAAHPTRILTDGAGRTVEIPQSVESVVCVGVGALRYTCYVGGQRRVVGVEDYEHQRALTRLYNYVNHHLFADLPAIGGNGEPWAESIMAVRPQVIVMSAYASADPDQLQQKTGIPVVVVPGSDALLDDGAYETIRLLGQLYGLEDRAQELTVWLRDMEAELAHRTAGIPEEDRPTAYVCGLSYQGAHGLEGTEAGYGPFALIGARNLADAAGRSGPFDIDPEQVLVWDPHVIFVDFNGLELIEAHRRDNPDYYDSLTAVREGRVYSQISFRSYAANLDTALADAWYAGTVLYPEEFADVDMEAKAGEIFTALLGADPYDDLKEAGYAFRPIQLIP